MKTRMILMLMALLFISSPMWAQKTPKLPKKQVAYIQTNAQCGDCKQRLEGVLNYERGVIYAELHLDSKQIEVKYNTKRTSIEKIREIISQVGYEADDVAPVQEAQAKLPNCCQPGGHD